MKSFYQDSVIFWTITRIALIVSFGIIAINTNFAQNQQYPFIFAGDLRNLLFIIIHGILVVFELRSKRKPFLTRAFAGGLSFLLTLTMVFWAFTENFAWIFGAIWVFLFGLYDAMDVQPYDLE